MIYPRILVDIKKIEHNAKEVMKKCQNASIMGVTKAFCANLDIVRAFEKAGVKYIADSRMQNLKKLKNIKLKKVLLRLPMISEAEDVVKYSDMSLNSEISTIETLNKKAKKLEKIHGVLLMIDLGDLREGIDKEDFFTTIEQIHKYSNISLEGIGTNFSCYGGVIPEQDNLLELVKLAKKYNKKYNKNLKIISGGASSSYHLLLKNQLPKGINNLRIGELILLSYETAYGKKAKNMYDDAFIFEAEIIELKEKASIPKGKIGVNAFGKKPFFEDRGYVKRAILAFGKQDVDANDLIPYDERIHFLGSSSDHTIYDVSACNYKVGDKIAFKLKYASLLSLFTSIYVKKVIKK